MRRIELVEAILLFLVVVAGGSVISGCTGPSELYLLNHPVSPNYFDAMRMGQLTAREIGRQQYEFAELRHDYVARNIGSEVTGTGIPVLSWRFGEDASEYSMGKSYARRMRDLRERHDAKMAGVEVARVVRGNESQR